MLAACLYRSLDAHSAFSLARLALEGDFPITTPGARRTQEATMLLEVAAVGGYEVAAFNLGIAHMSGIGGQPNTSLAIAWFEASHMPEGMNYIGQHHASIGNHDQAAHWKARAARMGFEAGWRNAAMRHGGILRFLQFWDSETVFFGRSRPI